MYITMYSHTSWLAKGLSSEPVNYAAAAAPVPIVVSRGCAEVKYSTCGQRATRAHLV